MWKYRKRPVVVEAIRLIPEHTMEIELLPDVILLQEPGEGADTRFYAMINTLEGRMFAKQGDWLIRGVAGEIYACKDEIFRQTYEPVGEDSDE